MRFIILNIFLSFLVSIINAYPHVREKRQVSPGIQKVLQDITSRLSDLEEGQEDDRAILNSINGFFNAIGIGQSANGTKHDKCGGWMPLTDSKCIKLLPSVYTMEEAINACDAEYTQDHDLESPKILRIDSKVKQDFVTRILRSGVYSSLTSFWINTNREFTNWGSGSPSNQSNRSCVELRNDGNPSQTGKWLDVTCDRKNSLICEKTISISYLQLMGKVIELSKKWPSMEDNVAKLQTKINKLEAELAKVKEEAKRTPPPTLPPKITTAPKKVAVIDFKEKNWAFNCDFVGNDLTSVVSTGEECGGRCADLPECTNFAWSDWTLDEKGPGTCWLKRGNMQPEDAVVNPHPYCVCGFIKRG